MDTWGDLSFLSSRNVSQRTALGRGRNYDAVYSAILKDYPATGPGPEPDVIADAIVDATFSSSRYGQSVAATHAILACACLRFKNIKAVLAIAKTKAIERVQALSAVEYPPGFHDSIQQLLVLQEDHDKMEKQMTDDIQNIEAKYNNEAEEKRVEINAAKAKYYSLVEPLFTKRYEILAGCVNGDEPGAEFGIPNFWYEAMMNSDFGMDEQITTHDAKALRYLTNIKWDRVDSEGLKLTFVFKPNPYFKNSELSKVVRGEVESEMGTSIDWYPGKCFTHINVKKRKFGVCDNCDNFETQEIKNLSFFNFFSTPSDEACDGYIGELLEKKVIPHAVTLFLDRSHHLATIEKLQGTGAA